MKKTIHTCTLWELTETFKIIPTTHVRPDNIFTVEIWKNDAGEIHHDSEPAVLVYNNDDNSIIQYWYMNGKIHRDADKPAHIEYKSSGKLDTERWYMNGKIHRVGDKPAQIDYSKNEKICRQIWYQYGSIHRYDHPAYIVFFDSGEIEIQLWYQNGVRKRNDGLAPIEYFDVNGNKIIEEWHDGGKIHRLDGPASISYENDMYQERWFINNEIIDQKDIQRVIGQDYTVPLTTSQQTLLKLTFG